MASISYNHFLGVVGVCFYSMEGKEKKTKNDWAGDLGYSLSHISALDQGKSAHRAVVAHQILVY